MLQPLAAATVPVSVSCPRTTPVLHDPLSSPRVSARGAAVHIIIIKYIIYSAAPTTIRTEVHYIVCIHKDKIENKNLKPKNQQHATAFKDLKDL